MPQSLAVIPVHCIFSTKGREAFLLEALRGELHAYMATVLRNLDCYPDTINSMPDHIHVLVGLSRTTSISDLIREIKTTTSRWIKGRDSRLAGFAWQNGYAAFAVCLSNIEKVRAYISNQAEHHRKRTFQEEYRAFLKKHGVAFDERYVWD